MIRVALVGNIASGKSTVEAILQQFGYLVLDTDKVCHKLLEHNSEIIEAFSSYDILDGNQNISREKLGKIVFSNLKLKTKLESILHPQIRKEILKFFEINKSQKIVFVAIPLLFEANMQDLFELGLSGKNDASIKREKLSRVYPLGTCSGKTLLKRINMLGLSKEDIKEALNGKDRNKD